MKKNQHFAGSKIVPFFKELRLRHEIPVPIAGSIPAASIRALASRLTSPAPPGIAAKTR